MNGFHANWPLAIIVIVALSWFIYRFLAPKRWREWAGAGLVQAFLIALYAEMYGFPLTIYLLVRFFGFDKTKVSANLWSTLLGHDETGMFIGMILGYTLVLLGAALLIVGWRQVHRAARENRLATDGLYGVVRHPQYTGILIAIFGEGIVHWPTVFSVALFPVIVAAYLLLARREEREMIEKFGDDYRAYQRRVPMLFPRWGSWKQLWQEARV